MLLLYNDSVSVQEIQLKIKGFMANPKVFSVALTIAIAAASFGAGKASNLVTGEILPTPAIAVTQLANTITPVTTSANTSVTPPEPQIGKESSSVSKEPSPKVTKTQITPKAVASSGNQVYVGSKNSTKYHLPTCPGAKAIKEENKIWFESKDEARANGYSPASNCKGI